MMTQEAFIEKMTDILDIDREITMDDKLSEIEEWDSLSVVSYIAMANTLCNRKVEIKAVRHAATVRDLYDLLQ